MEGPNQTATEGLNLNSVADVKSCESVDEQEKKPKGCGVEATHQHHVKKSKEDKVRKKDDKSVEQVLKALSSLGTTEEKLAAMCKKYSDIVDENRKLHLAVKQCEKRVGGLQKEKEQLQGEHSKAVLTRSRLENLCRELQRQNKAIKEESLLRIREEEEKRKEVSGKFQSTLSEITSLMEQNNENNAKLRDENIEMQNKFKCVREQYELREQQVEKISKQMQLESQLADAKLAKAKLEMLAEKEHIECEKKELVGALSAYQNKVQELQCTETALRGQITLYTDKYDEFQNALSKSNEVYMGFKGEMEKMSRKVTKLEKELATWKLKWENSHKSLLQMAAEKQLRDADLALSNRQLAQLQKLCRTLQSERSSLLVQLKSAGVTPQLTGEASTPGDNDVGTDKSPLSTPVGDAEQPVSAVREPETAAGIVTEDSGEAEEEAKQDPSTPTAVNDNVEEAESVQIQTTPLAEEDNSNTSPVPTALPVPTPTPATDNKKSKEGSKKRRK